MGFIFNFVLSISEYMYIYSIHDTGNSTGELCCWSIHQCTLYAFNDTIELTQTSHDTMIYKHPEKQALTGYLYPGMQAQNLLQLVYYRVVWTMYIMALANISYVSVEWQTWLCSNITTSPYLDGVFSHGHSGKQQA